MAHASKAADPATLTSTPASPPAAGGATTTTTTTTTHHEEPEEEGDPGLALYARVWALHQVLQLHQQAFLFPQSDTTTTTLAGNIVWYGMMFLVAWILLLLPSCHATRTTTTTKWAEPVFVTALVLRNAVRAWQCPFLWDSEYWLALTDLAVLSAWVAVRRWNDHPTIGTGHGGTGTTTGGRTVLTRPLDLAVPWIRYQLGICYGAAAFFKLNTSFLDARTSCAPIFVWSLLLDDSFPLSPWIRTLPEPTVQALSQLSPIGTILVEALVAALLLSPFRRYARLHHTWGIALALFFHFLIAVTPPPNGVPTFSCVAISRLILIAGDNGGRLAASVWNQIPTYGQYCCLAIGTAVAMTPRNASRTRTLDPSVVLFLLQAAVGVWMLSVSSSSLPPANVATPPSSHPRTSWMGTVLVGLAAFYAFVPPILGLQEIGSNTMFANARIHGGTNHLLGVPTGLLQIWWYSDADTTASDWFGGGIVRIEYTNSEYLNQLYPGEITELLAAPLRQHLVRAAGHVGRQFNPKARRVLGPQIRRNMPYWKENNDDDAATPPPPFVKYTVPALEFRRLLEEARRFARQTGTPFDLHYTRLEGATGDETWRKQSSGRRVVHILGDGGNATFVCQAAEPNEKEGNNFSDRDPVTRWLPCGPTELANLAPPSRWALKFMLFYPYAILPGDGLKNSPDELVCNY